MRRLAFGAVLLELAVRALCVGAGTGVAAAQGLGELVGQTIESVAYTSDGPVDTRELKRLIRCRWGIR